MSLSLRAEGTSSTEIGGTWLPRREENFPAAFGIVARALWPRKTAHTLAAIARKSDRAAKDWLSGKVDPPAIVIAAIVSAIVPRR